jgi:hypothetical protein
MEASVCRLEEAAERDDSAGSPERDRAVESLPEREVVSPAESPLPISLRADVAGTPPLALLCAASVELDAPPTVVRGLAYESEASAADAPELASEMPVRIGSSEGEGTGE